MAAINEYIPGLEAADKTLYGRPQLTNTKKLKTFTARVEGVSGQKNAHNKSKEYDSDFYHTGANRIAADSKRRLDLAALGINVITVTGGQIRNVSEFENLARLITKTLGKRLRYKMPEFLKAQRELRGLLLWVASNEIVQK